MAKLIAALIIGLALGAGAVLLVSGLTGKGESTSPVPRSLETSSNALTTTRTPASRPQVKSLADIQALPSEFGRNAALYARVQSADVDAVESLLDEAEGLTNPERIKQVIYSRYVQLDPRAALDRLRDEERDQQQLVRTTVSAAARFDLDVALAFIDTVDERRQIQLARNILDMYELSDDRKEQVAKRFALEPYLRRLQVSNQAKNDPVAAWQTALATEKGGERREMLWSVADSWFETDPAAALSAVASLDASLAGTRKSRLLNRWARQDPGAALEWAIAQPAPGQRDPLRLVAALVAVHSPREMFDLAVTLKPARRDMVAEMVLHAWAQTDPVAALDALAGMDNAQLRKTVGVSIVRAWTNDDPGAAFEWVRAHEPSPVRNLMLSTALRNLGKSDPLRALSFADNLDDTIRSAAIEWVLDVWGRVDPHGAAAWLDSSADTTPAAVTTVLGHYAKADVEAAFEWLRNQPVQAQRDAFPALVRQLLAATDSPDSAMRLIDRIRDSRAKQMAGVQLIAIWIDSDPQAAVGAIARMDDSASQYLYRWAFQKWSRSDLEGATAFLDRIPSSHRDEATQGTLEQAALTDIDLAERLFDHLKGDEARRDAATILFRSLREVDPERAERYRELSDVTGWQRIDIHL